MCDIDNEIYEFKQKMNITVPIDYVHFCMPQAIKTVGIPVNSTQEFIKKVLQQRFFCKCCTDFIKIRILHEEKVGRDRYLIIQDLLA